MTIPTIRQLLLSDLDQFQKIKLKGLQTDPVAFLATEDELKSKTEDQWKAWIQKDFILSAWAENGQLIATLHLIEQEPQKFKHIGILGGLYVDPAFRGQGIANLLLEKMLDHIKKQKKFSSLQLKVVTTNVGAIKLYESFGFSRWATEENALYHKGQYWDQYHYRFVLQS